MYTDKLNGKYRLSCTLFVIIIVRLNDCNNNATWSLKTCFDVSRSFSGFFDDSEFHFICDVMRSSLFMHACSFKDHTEFLL